MSVNVVEIFLPSVFPDGSFVPAAQLELVQQELVEQFGGVTAYNRAPAQGLWKDAGQVQADTMVVMEVMTPTIERSWWKAFRKRMEDTFHQKEILIRAHSASRL